MGGLYRILYCKVTEQQRDSYGRVFPLYFGNEKWVFGKCEKAVASVLLATDGMFETLFPYWKLYLYSDSNSSRSLLSCSYHGKQTNSTSDQITLNAGRYYVEITAGSQHSSTPYTLTVQR